MENLSRIDFFYNSRDVGFSSDAIGDVRLFQERELSKFLGSIEGPDGGIEWDNNFYASSVWMPDSLPFCLSLFGSGPLRSDAVDYVFSSDRILSPRVVGCSEKNYSWIEERLKLQRGESAHLSPGMFGYFLNNRKINYGKR